MRNYRFVLSVVLKSVLTVVVASHPLVAHAQLAFEQFATVSPASGWSFAAAEFRCCSRGDLAAYHPTMAASGSDATRIELAFRLYATVSPSAGWRLSPAISPTTASRILRRIIRAMAASGLGGIPARLRLRPVTRLSRLPLMDVHGWRVRRRRPG